MDETNKYILNWRNIVLKAAEALNKKDFELYEMLMQKANDSYEEYKRDSALTYECKNFGMSNFIFEDALPKLFKTNKKAVKEFITTIKEDKNLLYQFQFYKALEKYNKQVKSSDYINEALNIVYDNIDIKNINESNKKLSDIIKKYNIKPNDFISEENLKLFESCDFLFKNKKKLTNLNYINENLNNVASYTEKNYNFISEEKNNVFEDITKFDEKYNKLLNEEEKDFVKEIMSFKNNDNDKKKEILFNKFKNECLNIINNLISESNDEDKYGLLEIKEQINNKQFCIDTLVKDMAKLLEIRDVLLN